MALISRGVAVALVSRGVGVALVSGGVGVALISRGIAVALCLALLGGCAAGPGAKGGAPTRPTKDAAHARAKAEAPQATAAPDWESFTHTGAALRGEIARRAKALGEGPIGNRAVELASLRLAASGRDLVDAGSLDGALEVLQRAVSLWGSNGYAYLYLAYVHHVQGRAGRAGEFAASARRYLPRDEPVRAELEGLDLSIRQGGATAGS